MTTAPELELLCKSANGVNVGFDPIYSHTATHFHDSPELRNTVIDLVSGLIINEDVVADAFDAGSVVGNSDVVIIDETDEIVYAMRKNREDQGYVPFTKSRQTEPSSLISVYLVKKDESNYELLSAWIGEYIMPPFPEMSNATNDSATYWHNHAFVWGSQAIIEGSERSDCPW